MSLTNLIKNQAKGKGNINLCLSTAASGLTAANSTSGYLFLNICGNVIDSIAGSLTSMNMPNENFIKVASNTHGVATQRVAYIVRLYKVGTCSLTSLGNIFVASGSQFPLKHNEMGTTVDVSLIPIIYVNSSLSATAASFTINYKNQLGSSITGTKIFTFPSATTALGSAFRLPLEDTDYAAQDITAINITTASVTGSATIYLMEIVSLVNSNYVSGTPVDYLVSCPMLQDRNPYVGATGGNVDKITVNLGFGSSLSNANITEIGVYL
jgi:hypothetical protein